ncbi:MAG: arginase family protein [Anaerolineae bacterium]|nr:arginase family protein [Anaerolineae bacterium]
MTSHQFALIEAPSNLGLKPQKPNQQPGVRRMPNALKQTGIMSGLKVEQNVRVEAPAYQPERDSVTGVRNINTLPDYSIKLATAIGQALDASNFPIVLGGDCSILLGSTLALRERGRYGLIFMDGHCDFLTPTSTGTGGAAGMDLALVCGVGPSKLTDLKGLSPLVRTTDVVILANRDIDEDSDYEEPAFIDAHIKRIGLQNLRELGIAQAVEEAINHLAQNNVQGFWIHVDVDVLDSAIMPAVD